MRYQHRTTQLAIFILIRRHYRLPHKGQAAQGVVSRATRLKRWYTIRMAGARSLQVESEDWHG
jgi:hypothetical protein